MEPEIHVFGKDNNFSTKSFMFGHLDATVSPQYIPFVPVVYNLQPMYQPVILTRNGTSKYSTMDLSEAFRVIGCMCEDVFVLFAGLYQM